MLPNGLSQEKQEILKSTELARIAVIPNNEGPLHTQSIKIPHTSLYAYVQILFDDNMEFFEGGAQALNVEIALSSRRDYMERSIISSTTAQVAIDKYFKSNLRLTGRWKRKLVAVDVTCVGPKPNE